MSSLENEFLDRLEKHKGVIFKISKMYMDNTEDQSDLFQEITYQAWKSYTSFEGKSVLNMAIQNCTKYSYCFS